MLERQNIITGVYRFLIVGLLFYTLVTSAGSINQTLIITASILVMYAIIFSVIGKHYITTYIEWFAILFLIVLMNGQMLLFFLLIAPLSQFVSYKLKQYEMIALAFSLALAAYMTFGELMLPIILGVASYMSILLINSNFLKINKLEKKLSSYEKENRALKMQNSKMKNQINISSRLFFHKKIIEDIDTFKHLISQFVDSTQKLFNSDYVGFYMYNKGVYHKMVEKGEVKDTTFPKQVSEQEGEETVYQDNILKMPIKFQKQPWGRIVIYGKKTKPNNGEVHLDIPFEDKDFETMSMMVETIIYRLKDIKKREKLEQAAHYDRLTGLSNRNYMSKKLFSQYEYIHKKTGKDLFVLMLDIDDFKTFNDTFGHDVGDDVLRNVARVASETLQQKGNKDILGRWGGEEFIGFLSGSKEENENKAESIRRAIEQIELKQQKITVSIGLAKYEGNGESLDDVTKKADIALYNSKENGKNQYTIYEKGMKQ